RGVTYGTANQSHSERSFKSTESHRTAIRGMRAVLQSERYTPRRESPSFHAKDRMPIARHLRDAPITEAIIDFRVKARSAFDPKEFNRLKPELLARFPKMDEARFGSITFQFPPTGATPPVMEAQGLQGVLFRSADEKLVTQFRTDGFTLNRLKPYSSWEELF